MSDLDGIPEDWFSRVAAHVIKEQQVYDIKLAQSFGEI